MYSDLEVFWLGILGRSMKAPWHLTLCSTLSGPPLLYRGCFQGQTRAFFGMFGWASYLAHHLVLMTNCTIIVVHCYYLLHILWTNSGSSVFCSWRFSCWSPTLNSYHVRFEADLYVTLLYDVEAMLERVRCFPSRAPKLPLHTLDTNIIIQ